MTLEKDISQRSFRNLQQKSIVNLIYTYHWVVEKIKELFVCRRYYASAV